MVQIKGPEDAVGLVIHLDRNQRPREDQWGQRCLQRSWGYKPGRCRNLSSSEKWLQAENPGEQVIVRGELSDSMSNLLLKSKNTIRRAWHFTERQRNKQTKNEYKGKTPKFVTSERYFNQGRLSTGSLHKEFHRIAKKKKKKIQNYSRYGNDSKKQYESEDGVKGRTGRQRARGCTPHRPWEHFTKGSSLRPAGGAFLSVLSSLYGLGGELSLGDTGPGQV